MANPVTVTVGPLATADADGVSTSQKAAGAQYLVINGALSNGQTADNVCQSQTPSGAGALTLNGSLVSSVQTGSAVAYLGSMCRIYFTHAGNDSGRTLTIVGTGVDYTGGVYAVKETLTGANASVVASQQLYYTITSITISGSAAGAITVGRAGIATMDNPRRVDITSGDDDTDITFTITGTDVDGSVISEVLTGADTAAATSVLSYKTVTSILTSGAVQTTVEVGSSAMADSEWIRFDDFAANAQTSVIVAASGTVNWDVEVSNGRPDTPGAYEYQNPALMTWLDTLDTELVGETASKNGVIAITPLWARITLNSGDGTVRGTFRQVFYG